MKFKVLSGLRQWSSPRREVLVDKALERSVGLGSWVIGFVLASVMVALCARALRALVQFSLAIVAIGPLGVFMFAGFGAAKLAQYCGWGMWAFKKRGWMDERADDVDKLVQWCESARRAFTAALWCLPLLGWAWSMNLAARVAAARRLALLEGNAWGLNAYALAWVATLDSGREIWSQDRKMGWSSFHPDDEGLALSAEHPMGWCGWLMGGKWSVSGLSNAKGRGLTGTVEWADGVERLIQARAIRRELGEASGAGVSAGRSARRL